MRKTIKKQYFHICGMQTSKERTGVTGDPNYIMAGVYYDSKKGYYSDIRPVYLYTLDGVEMVGIAFGLKVAVGSLSEVLVPCNRQSKKNEAEAVKIYEDTVISAITKRLKYRIDIGDKAFMSESLIKGYKDTFDILLMKRTALVIEQFKEDGEDVNDTETKQSIKEAAYNYFLSDEFRKEADEETWHKATAGRMLLEEGSPEKVIELIERDYDEECPFEDYAESDKKLIDMMQALVA